MTGGEDSKIIAWRGPQLSTSDGEEKYDTMELDSPKVKRKRQDTMDIDEHETVSCLLVPVTF